MCGLRRDFEIRQNLIFKGNTAQFPPCGLSTAPAAAALRIMRYCLIFFYAKMDGQLS